MLHEHLGKIGLEQGVAYLDSRSKPAATFNLNTVGEATHSILHPNERGTPIRILGDETTKSGRVSCLLRELEYEF